MEAVVTSGKPMYVNQTIRCHVAEENFLRCGIKLQNKVKSHFRKVSHLFFCIWLYDRRSSDCYGLATMIGAVNSDNYLKTE
jgi:hypothetical protein